jgi:serine O-acetyltransferase
MFKQIKLDIDTVLARDPAAHSRAEVLLCYPGIRALFWYRISHKAYLKKHYLRARYISSRVRHKTGIEIHPGATIGQGLFIDHGSGVVVGETAIIGDNVTLYQGVTLGGTGKDTGKRHPTVLNGVTIGAGAKILGPITLGECVKVGAGSIVLKDVPANCTVVGNPGRVVKKKLPSVGIDLDQVNLPDPMLDRLENLVVRLTALEDSIRNQACKLGYDVCPLQPNSGQSTHDTDKKEI